jgi:hypothetical protein
MRPIAWLGLIAVAALGSASVRAQPLYRSERSGGVTCSSPTATCES